MNLELDVDQRDLVAVATDVCDALKDDWRRPGINDHARSLKALAAVGILGVRHPEPDGSGLGPVEAALAAEVCGAVLAPTPLLLWADLVGSAVPGVLEGDATITGTFDQARAICYGGSTTYAVIVDETGAKLVRSEAAQWKLAALVDPTTPRAVMCGDIPAGSVPIADAAETDRWRWQSHVLMSAHLVGVGSAAVQVSSAYAKERHQFGSPIGSFQAVKHLLADAYTAVELARSQTLVAALCWAENDLNAPDQALAAAIVSTQAALTAAQTAIQIHGGMGFTSEALPHLLYKRALQLQSDLDVAGARAPQFLHRPVMLNGVGSAGW